MANYTFEYCSLYYLNQWFAHDKNYCQTLSLDNKESKLAVLKKAASFYGIARNLPRKFEEKEDMARYQPVLEILDEVEYNQFQTNPVERILEIEKEISKKYGHRSVLSLTTKFLWLKVKQPILIYDSQARVALGIKNGDLRTYYEKWRETFKGYQNQVENACSKLPDLHLYAIDQDLGTKEYIKDISSKSWFHERVFDIYLWSEGNRG